MTQSFNLNGKTLSPCDAGFQSALHECYSSKVRPLCLCKKPALEMYIAKLKSSYVVKRMPLTGDRHDVDCPSFELPPELSGLGEVMGGAIKDNMDDGTTTLKLGFPLSKGRAHKAGDGIGSEKDSVSSDGKKLSLRGILHYLWEQAGFNRWSPAMADKRNWYVIRKYLYEAAQHKMAKGVALDSVLFIPEMFRVEQKDDIAKRRLLVLKPLTTQHSGSTPLMVIIGEIKEITTARYGYKIVLKHLPDFHVMLDEDIYRRMIKRFGGEIELWGCEEQSHLIVVGTFSLSVSGIPKFEELSLMNVSAQWLPFEHQADYALVNGLVDAHKNFIKPLRYNLPSGKPIASAIVTTKNRGMTAIYVCPALASADYKAAVAKLMNESSIPCIRWDAGDEGLPNLATVA